MKNLYERLKPEYREMLGPEKYKYLIESLKHKKIIGDLTIEEYYDLCVDCKKPVLSFSPFDFFNDAN